MADANFQFQLMGEGPKRGSRAVRPANPGAHRQRGSAAGSSSQPLLVTDRVVTSPSPARTPNHGVTVNASARTRSRERPQGGQHDRRALPLADGSPTEVSQQALSTRGSFGVTRRLEARGGPGPSVQQDVLIDVLRGELQAAMQLMEHREAWWQNGLRNAELAVGLEVDQIRDSEVSVAHAMREQMTSLTDVLRNTQMRAENSAMTALDQKRIVKDLNAYSGQLTTQGRLMMANSEQQHWRMASETKQANAHAVQLESNIRAVESRALFVLDEYRSVKTEAEELSSSRLHHGLEAQLVVEGLRGELHDANEQSVRAIAVLTSELEDARTHLQSSSTLRELLKQT